MQVAIQLRWLMMRDWAYDFFGVNSLYIVFRVHGAIVMQVRGTMSRRILVTGASGFVGRILCDTLASRGYRVVGLGRSRAEGFRDGIDYVTCDLQTHDLNKVITGSFDVVFHLAGLAHGKGGRLQQKDGFRSVNVDVSVRVAEAAIRAGIGRFIFISSIGVHGASTSSTPVTENSPLAPNSLYAQSKLDAEVALATLFQGNELSGLVIVRPPLVYGARAPGSFQSLLRLAASQLPLPFGSCTNCRSVISVFNLVAFLTVCIDHPQASNQIFVISDGEAVSTKQIVSSLRHGMNRRSVLLPVSPFVMRIALTLVGRLDMYLQLFGDLKVDSQKAEQLLGWRPDRNTLQQLEAVGASYANSHP